MKWRPSAGSVRTDHMALHDASATQIGSLQPRPAERRNPRNGFAKTNQSLSLASPFLRARVVPRAQLRTGSQHGRSRDAVSADTQAIEQRLWNHRSQSRGERHELNERGPDQPGHIRGCDKMLQNVALGKDVTRPTAAGQVWKPDQLSGVVEVSIVNRSRRQTKEEVVRGRAYAKALPPSPRPSPPSTGAREE